MITLKDALEVFSDTKVFKLTEKSHRLDGKRIYDYELVDSKSELWHYTFCVKETTYNEGATVDFGRWHPLDAQVQCFDICNLDFLLAVISELRKGKSW